MSSATTKPIESRAGDTALEAYAAFRGHGVRRVNRCAARAIEDFLPEVLTRAFTADVSRVTMPAFEEVRVCSTRSSLGTVQAA